MTPATVTYRDIEVNELEASGGGQRYLLTHDGRHFEANAMVVDLLRTLQAHDDEAAAIAEYTRKCNGRYSAGQVEAFVAGRLRPIVAGEGKTARRQFLYERELLPAAAIARVSDTLKVMFTPWLMVAVVVAVLAADVWFMLTADDMLKVDGDASIYGVAGLLLFMCGSSLFHELGHAAACRRMGVDHGGIGFGMYLTFPVFYTDVSRVWRLPRLKRIVVNLAGIYFQCFILGALLLWYGTGAAGHETARYLVLTMNLGFALTLNPFFRFDGYWIASDALGVPNLRRRSQEMAGYLWRRLRRKPDTGPKPYLLQMSGAARWIMAVYIVAVNAFMGFYFFGVLPGFLWSFAQSFPAEANRLIIYVGNGMTPPFALIRNIVMQLLFLAMIGYMVYGLTRPLWRRYAERKRK